MPLTDERMRVLEAALGDPAVVAGYRAKILQVPGYGAAALNSIPVLGHACDNPICQRMGAGHVHPSSHAQNRRAFLARRFLAGSPLGDPRGARGRSREFRDMTRADPAAVAADQARLLRMGLHLPLFDV